MSITAFHYFDGSVPVSVGNLETDSIVLSVAGHTIAVTALVLIPPSSALGTLLAIHSSMFPIFPDWR